MPAAAKKKPAPAAFSLDDAPVAAAPIKKSSATEADVIEMELTDAWVTMRRFEALAKSGRLLIETDLKALGATIHVNRGVKLGAKPDNFVGHENGAKANVIFSKRNVRSVVTEEQKELFVAQFGAQWVTDHLDVETTPVTYTIPEAYINDPIMREKITTALNTIPDVPKDIVVRTLGVTTMTVSEKTVNAVFASRDAEVVEQFLPLIMTCGLKVTKAPVIVDIDELLNKAGRILNLPKLKAQMTEALNDPEAVLSESFDKKKPAKRK